MNFAVAFKRMPDQYKRGTFQQILDGFKQWAPHQPVTDKQVKSMGIESNYKNDKYIGDKATNIQVRYKNKKGNVIIKWKDAVTGMYMRGENDISRIPHWRKNDTEYKRGVLTNLETGDKLKIRYTRGKYKGQLKTKDKWLLVDKSGKVTRLYPKEKTYRKARRRR